jgi:3-hydroxy-9,10-secoandrosta-1,3,5(10)-triene-9,17-dione monooxygenase reductase component
MMARTSSFDQARFREVLGHFATGVTIVTAMEEAGPVGFTCQAFSALSLDPPMVVLAPAKDSTSWPKIAKAGWFCVNILESKQEAICRTFAVSGVQKFEGVGWSPAASGAPVLDGCLAWIDCELELSHDAGDHELVLGRVHDLGVEDGTPLLYYRSGFGRFTV